METLPTYLTTQEAADFMRLSTRTLEQQRLDGTGAKYVKAGRRVLYRVTDLESYLQARTFSSTSEAEAALDAA